MKLIRTNIYVRRDHQKALRAKAKKTGESVSTLIRQAIEEYLKKK